MSVKNDVWERDNHCCIFCGCSYGAMPNAHYISRANGGLGIAQNVVTACTSLTEDNCHYLFDNGPKEVRERMREQAKMYLKSKYPDWDETKLIYKK